MDSVKNCREKYAVSISLHLHLLALKPRDAAWKPKREKMENCSENISFCTRWNPQSKECTWRGTHGPSWLPSWERIACPLGYEHLPFAWSPCDICAWCMELLNVGCLQQGPSPVFILGDRLLHLFGTVQHRSFHRSFSQNFFCCKLAHHDWSQALLPPGEDRAHWECYHLSVFQGWVVRKFPFPKMCSLNLSQGTCPDKHVLCMQRKQE